MTMTSRPRRKLFTRDIVVPAIWASFRKLDPRVQIHNPVMFVVEVGSVITTGIFIADLVRGRTDSLWFTGVVALVLWLTVLFANFAEAVAEGRGRAQANALRATRSEMRARRLEGGVEETIPAADLRPGDVVVCEAGDLIPGDGDVIDGVASVDESAITGESAPVIRESGGDSSAPIVVGIRETSRAISTVTETSLSA
jgi:K+-transporting ATPase ATPase B chain